MDLETSPHQAVYLHASAQQLQTCHAIDAYWSEAIIPSEEIRLPVVTKLKRHKVVLAAVYRMQVDRLGPTVVAVNEGSE